MKKTIHILISTLTLMFFSCHFNEKENRLTTLINRDVPKFITALPDLPHNDMEQAFKKVNLALNYKVKEVSTSAGTFESSSEIQPGESLLDGQISLLASKLTAQSARNEFGISLILYPPPANDSILYDNVNRLMKDYKKPEANGHPAWIINDWLLQIKGPNILVYYPSALTK